MRTLRFIVDDESIIKDPSCDFTGLFPKTNYEIRAEFVFSPEWKSRVKVAAFWSMLDKEYHPQVLEEDNTCMIPKEIRRCFLALLGGSFLEQSLREFL